VSDIRITATIGTGLSATTTDRRGQEIADRLPHVTPARPSPYVPLMPRAVRCA
jgi:hypothetical protein